MSPVLVLVLLMLGVACLLLLDVLTRRPEVATLLVLGLVVLDAAVDSSLVSAELAGFRVSPADAGFGLVAGAALMRFFHIERMSPEQRWISVLGVMCFASLLLGVASAPLSTAVNDFRTYLGFVAPALYFSTVFDTEARRAMLKPWFWTAMAMAAIVIVRWTARLGGIELGVFGDSFDAAIRVLNGPKTMFVASAAVLLLLAGSNEVAWTEYRRERQLGTLLLILAILLNRRTVWLALIVALVLMLSWQGGAGKRAAKVAGSGLVVLVVALTFSYGTLQGDRTFAQSATDLDTLEWRLSGWQEMLESHPEGPINYVIGMPFGSGFVRTNEGTEVEVGPHSFYVQTFLRTGIVGLAALVTAMGLAFVALLQRPSGHDGPLSGRLLVVLIVMQAVWLLAWTPGPEQGVILGLAVASASRADTRSSGGLSVSQSLSSRKR